MKINRRAVMAGTTFFLAAATGHVMQSSVHMASEQAATIPVAQAEPVKVAEAVAAPAVVLPPDTPITQLSADLTQAGAEALPDLPTLDATTFADVRGLSARMRALQGEHSTATMPSDDGYSAFGLKCGPSVLAAAAAPKAMIAVTLDAPCHENQLVTISHAGLDLSLRTDAKGHLAAEIPAFDAEGSVTVRVGSDAPMTASAPVKGLERMARLAVVSTAAQPIALSIYENGAEFGEAGHITAEHPHNTKSKRSGQFYALGNATSPEGYLTAVYQYAPKSKSVRMEIAAEATAATCGTVAVGRVITLKRGVRDSHDISLTMPECGDASGLVVMDLTPEAKLTVAAAKQP